MANTYTYPVENIQELRERFTEYFTFARYDAAYDIYSDLSRYIEEHAVDMNAASHVLAEYQDMRAKAGWYIFDRLPAEQVLPLFEKHLQYFFDETWERRKEQLRTVCATIPIIANRDELKKYIRTAIEKSNVPIGDALLNINGSSMPPTMSNWIADFRQTFATNTIPDSLVLTQYLNTAPNVQSASENVRKRVEGLLRFYMYVLTPSQSIEGADEIYYYHDVYTGTVHLFRDGRDIDTGEKSPIVASMSPEEIAIAKKQIEDESRRIGRIDIDAVNNGDLTTLKEYFADVESAAANTLNTSSNTSNTSDVDRKQELQNAMQAKVVPAAQPRVAVAAKSVAPVMTPQAQAPSTSRVSVAAQPPVVAPAPIPSTAPQAPAPVPVSQPQPQKVIAPQPVASPVTTTRAPQPKPKQAQQLQGVDTVTLAQQVLSDHGLLLDSAQTEKRFISLIAAYAKGEQERKEVMQALVTPSDQGGINVTAGIAASLLRNTDELIAFPERIRQRKSLQTAAEQKAPRPTLAMVQELMQREKQFNQQTGASLNAPTSTPASQSVEDIFANLNTTVKSHTEQEVKPQVMLSQRAPQQAPVAGVAPRQTTKPLFVQSRDQQVMGPIDELKNFSLEEFRAYGGNPLAATEALLQKVNILGQQSVAKRAEGIRAWQQSPVHQMYVAIGNSSLQSGVPVDQYIVQQQQTGATILTAGEFDAISQLNRMLRY